MSGKMKEIHCECTDEIVCPHCGYEFNGSWEYDDDDGELIECQNCDESFELSVDVSVTYTSRKING